MESDLVRNVASEMYDCDTVNVEFADILRADDPFLDWVSDRLITEVSHDLAGTRLCYDALALQTTVHLLRGYASVQHRIQTSYGRLLASQVRAIVEFVDDNLERNLTLDELAAICNLSPLRFSRQFKRHFGIGPQEYLQTRKVERACALLRRDHAPLKEIALLCGFSDQSHLTRAFRRHVGTTPGEYRYQTLQGKQ